MERTEWSATSNLCKQERGVESGIETGVGSGVMATRSVESGACGERTLESGVSSSSFLRIMWSVMLSIYASGASPARIRVRGLLSGFPQGPSTYLPKTCTYLDPKP